MAFQFKVQLKDISGPTVWRKLLVPEQFSFFRFHKVIQAAFGWENCHLFQFAPTGFNSYPIIAIPNAEWDDEPPLDSKKTKLSAIFIEPKQKLIYTYDFGDNWDHIIMLEKIIEEKIIRADCLAGQGACPPEDCGGAWGYADLKKTMQNPKDPEYAGMKEWLGISRSEAWNPTAFSLERAKHVTKRM